MERQQRDAWRQCSFRVAHAESALAPKSEDGEEEGEGCVVCRAIEAGTCGVQFSVYTACVDEWYGLLTEAREEAARLGKDPDKVHVDMSDDWRQRYAQSMLAYKRCCDREPEAKELAMIISPHLWADK